MSISHYQYTNFHKWGNENDFPFNQHERLLSSLKIITLPLFVSVEKLYYCLIFYFFPLGHKLQVAHIIVKSVLHHHEEDQRVYLPHNKLLLIFRRWIKGYTSFYKNSSTTTAMTVWTPHAWASAIRWLDDCCERSHVENFSKGLFWNVTLSSVDKY